VMVAGRAGARSTRGGENRYHLIYRTQSMPTGSG
jgi:hypothetical protein